MKKIIAFSGSNSSRSINQKLIHMVSKYINGAHIEVIDLRDFPAILYGIDEEEANGIPASIKALKKTLDTADGFIISTPEHNISIPVMLKNTIDWLSRIESKFFNHKPVVFLSTSTGARGGKSALQHLVTIMPFRGAQIIGSHSIGSFNEKVVDGDLIDSEKTIVLELVKQLTNAL